MGNTGAMWKTCWVLRSTRNSHDYSLAIHDTGINMKVGFQTFRNTFFPSNFEVLTGCKAYIIFFSSIRKNMEIRYHIMVSSKARA